MRYFLAFFLSLGLLFSAQARNVATQIPADLMYLDKPIDALCFSAEENNNLNTIQLNQCGLKKENYTSTGEDKSMTARGYIGFDWKDSSIASPSVGYSYYRIFPASQHQYWIYSINNTGGSGEFTAINLVTRKDVNTLEVKPLMGGDRCNGGIQDVQRHMHFLQFSVNLTAFDLLALTNENSKQLQAYDDLAACAICCVGKAFYKVKPDLKPTFLFAKLTPVKTDELPTQGKYQQCFNELLKKYLSSGKIKLNEKQLTEFGKQFNERCVK